MNEVTQYKARVISWKSKGAEFFDAVVFWNRKPVFRVEEKATDQQARLDAVEWAQRMGKQLEWEDAPVNGEQTMRTQIHTPTDIATRPVMVGDRTALSAEEKEERDSCEQRISAGMETFADVGNAILTIRDKRLYREQFETFENYCQARWSMTARRARQLCDAAKVVEDLTPVDGPMPATESQARPLTKLPAAQRAKVWREVVATAPAGRVTAKHVDEVVEANRWPKPNEFGVWTSPLKIPFKHKDVEAQIGYLQVGPSDWVSSWSWSFKCGNCSSASGLPGIHDLRFESKQRAIFAAATNLLDGARRGADPKSLSVIPKQASAFKKLSAWIGGVINSNAEKQEPLKLEAPEKRGGDPSLVDLGREIRAAVLDRAQNAVVAIRSLQDLLMADVTNSWLCTEAVNSIEKIEANIKRPIETPKHGVRGETRLQQSTRDKAAAKSKLFVLCREPSKGAIGAAKKPRYDSGGGWTIDPKKAKTFTIAAATERARDYEVVVPVEKALRRFEKGL